MNDQSKPHSPTPPSDNNRPLPDADQTHRPLDDDDQVSGTDIAGDETNVRTREGLDKPGIADAIPPQPK
jgi:hypothetical protein